MVRAKAAKFEQGEECAYTHICQRDCNKELDQPLRVLESRIMNKLHQSNKSIMNSAVQ